MAEKKKTQKKSTTKSKKIQLTFHPVASGAKEMNIVLKTKEYEERDGRKMAITVPLIKGLPTMLTIAKDEVIEVTKAQCDELEKLGLVETEAEYKERKAFVDNLKTQHPDRLSYAQMDGANGDLLTLRDSQHKVYMDKLIRL